MAHGYRFLSRKPGDQNVREGRRNEVTRQSYLMPTLLSLSSSSSFSVGRFHPPDLHNALDRAMSLGTWDGNRNKKDHPALVSSPPFLGSLAITALRCSGRIA